MNISPNRHLGSLCKNSHDWNGTGNSLRNKREKCCECMKESYKRFRIKHRLLRLKYAIEYNKTYYQDHKEEIKIQTNKYYQTHKTQRNQYQKEKMKTNIKYKLSHNISVLMNRSLKRNKNGYHWEILVGYTLKDLIKHLEKHFLPGMSWDNFCEWHIDHKIPISVFNFSKPEHLDFKRCWSLNNLQPLWAKDNISKNDSLKDSFQPSFKLEG